MICAWEEVSGPEGAHAAIEVKVAGVNFAAVLNIPEIWESEARFPSAPAMEAACVAVEAEPGSPYSHGDRVPWR